MRTHVLERSQLVPHPRDEVFAFFADARNLEAITPAFLRFRILTPGPIAMGAGALIDYQLSLAGIPFSWRTRIEVYEPGVRFADVQLRGPYARWHHLHTFEDAPGGTRVGDRVEYALPLGPLGDAAHALFVRRTLGRIFDHRREAIARLLAGGATRPAPVTAPAGAP